MIEALSSIHYLDYCDYVFTTLSKKKIFLVFILVSLACIILLTVYLIINITKGVTITFMTCLPLIGVVCFVLFYFALYGGMTYKQYKNGKKYFNEETSYLFFNNKLVIAKAGTTTGLNVFYEHIIEIKEKRKRIYFFIEQDKSYVMRKDRFVKGNIKELRELLKEHCKKCKIKLGTN